MDSITGDTVRSATTKGNRIFAQKDEITTYIPRKFGTLFSVIPSSSFSYMSSNFCVLCFRKCFNKICLILRLHSCLSLVGSSRRVTELRCNKKHRHTWVPTLRHN